MKGSVMKRLLTIAAASLALASTAARAEEAQRRLDVEPFMGAYLPTGDQRDVLEDAFLAGVTASYDVHRYLAVVGTFSWSPTQVKGLAAKEDLDLLQYDLGVEGHYPFALGGGLTLQPFVAVGGGARTYSFRDLDVDAETDLAGYVAAGVSAQRGAFTVRVGARDALTDFDGLSGDGADSTRNDLAVFAGVGMRF
jgi:opacity protein-like surface antigen